MVYYDSGKFLRPYRKNKNINLAPLMNASSDSSYAFVHDQPLKYIQKME